MFKKVIALMIALIFVAGMPGCSGSPVDPSGKAPGEGTADPSGGTSLYNEIEIGSNSGIISPEDGRINSKDQLVVFDRGAGEDAGFVILDKDGKPAGKIKFVPSGMPGVFDLDREDNIYMLLREQSQKIVVINPSGEITDTFELGTDDANGEVSRSSVVTDLAVDGAGNIYLATLSGIRVLNKDGKELNKIGSDGYYSMDTDDEGNLVTICFGTGKQTLEKINPSNGKSIWSIDLDLVGKSSGGSSSFSADSLKLRYDGSSKSYCLMNAGGVARYDAEGKQPGTVLDFLQYFILASGNTPSDLNIDSKGNFYITTARDNNYEIWRYDVQAGTHKAEARTEITVAVPVSEKWMEIAAVKFQKENPGYSVKIKPYEQEYQYGGNYENYVKALNTELLTGKGPDIFLASGLPIRKYIGKNLLADLGGYMEKDGSFDDSHYYMNILNALKYDNRFYTLPVSISFNVLAVDKKILEKESVSIDDSAWNWKEAIAAGRKLTGSGGSARKLFMPVTSSMLLDYLLQGNYSQFLDLNGKKASFNTQEFIDLLKMVKEFGESGQSGTHSYSANYSDPEAIEKGSIVFNPQVFMDYTSYAFLRSLYKDQVKLLKYPAAGDAQGKVFNPQALLALNNNSRNKDVAWEFLRLLLSDEIQSEELSGFAVNRSALKKVAEWAVEMTTSGGMAYAIQSGNDDKPKIFTPSPLTQDDIDYINSFIENMSICNSTDMQVQKIVSGEAAAYFSGSKSPEETAKLIQQKVELYLGE